MNIYYYPTIVKHSSRDRKIPFVLYTEECFQLMSTPDRKGIKLLDEEGVKTIGDRPCRFATLSEILNGQNIAKNLQAQNQDFQ